MQTLYPSNSFFFGEPRFSAFVCISTVSFHICGMILRVFVTLFTVSIAWASIRNASAFFATLFFFRFFFFFNFRNRFFSLFVRVHIQLFNTTRFGFYRVCWIPAHLVEQRLRNRILPSRLMFQMGLKRSSRFCFLHDTRGGF